MQLFRRTQILTQKQESQHGLADNHRLRSSEDLRKQLARLEFALVDQESPHTRNQIDRDNEHAERIVKANDHLESMRDYA